MNRAETIQVPFSCLVVLAVIGVFAAGNAVAETPAEKLRSVFANLCGEPIERLKKSAEAVGLKVLEFDELEPRPDFFRHDIRLQSDEKNEIRLVRFEQAGQIRHFSAEYYSRSSVSDGDLEPVLLAAAKVAAARVSYGTGGGTVGVGWQAVRASVMTSSRTVICERYRGKPVAEYICGLRKAINSSSRSTVDRPCSSKLACSTFTLAYS